MNLEPLIAFIHDNGRTVRIGKTAEDILTEYTSKSIQLPDTDRKGWRTVAQTDDVLSGMITKHLTLAIESTKAPTAQALAAVAQILSLTTEQAAEKVEALHYNLQNTLACYQAGDGVNFADPKLQELIALLQLFGWTSQFVTRVQSLAYRNTSQALIDGNADATEADMQAALTIAKKDRLLVWLANTSQVIANTVRSGETTTIDQMKTIFANFA